VDAGDRPAGATSPTASSGPTLIDAVTDFSWLLEAGATGILPVYAAVGGPRGFAARTCGSAVHRYLASLLAVVVTAVAEVTEFYVQQRDLPLGAGRDAVRDNPTRLLALGD
jgi:hypothetical protein